MPIIIFERFTTEVSCRFVYPCIFIDLWFCIGFSLVKHDKNLQEGYSNLVPAFISKKNGLSEGNSNCVTKEQFKDLQDYMYVIIKQISNEILSGKIDLTPYYKNKKTPCKYCNYKSICNFNNGACFNKYNYIEERSKKEILEKIREEKIK